jgi:hypothetical protein
MGSVKMAVASSNLPEPSQSSTTRQRLYVATEVARSILLAHKQHRTVIVRYLKVTLSRMFDCSDSFPKQIINPLVILYIAEERVVNAA